jgi:hypothetical protein
MLCPFFVSIIYSSTKIETRCTVGSRTDGRLPLSTATKEAKCHWDSAPDAELVSKVLLFLDTQNLKNIHKFNEEQLFKTKCHKIKTPTTSANNALSRFGSSKKQPKANPEINKAINYSPRISTNLSLNSAALSKSSFSAAACISLVKASIISSLSRYLSKLSSML